MLSIIWLTVGALVSFWCCYMEIETNSEERENPLKWMFGAIFATVIALTVTGEATVKPAYDWLLAALPEAGTDMNWVTALVLTAVGCATYAFGLPLAFLYGLEMRHERGKKDVGANSNLALDINGWFERRKASKLAAAELLEKVRKNSRARD